MADDGREVRPHGAGRYRETRVWPGWTGKGRRAADGLAGRGVSGVLEFGCDLSVVVRESRRLGVRPSGVQRLEGCSGSRVTKHNSSSMGGEFR